ncbi:hypothetical protein [Flexithrix dorotheae]|uniref:hypothetical protein n=1 Tax=Flexithrix dorotheae TaxID=70993 RepID=UPI00037B70D9|nr:hypothetical protein [Flexithrix dorotheae]
MNKISFLFLAVVLIFFSECKKEADKDGDIEQDSWEEEEQELPLNSRVDLLLDSIHSLDKQAIASENEKINTTKLLVEEIKNIIPNYNTALVASIEEKRALVEENLYSKVTMEDESFMVAYDDYCQELMDKIQEFATSTDEFEKYKRAALLSSDILEANHRDFMIRKNYNNYVLEFNVLLEEKGDKIRELGVKYQGLNKFPLFYGDPES